jgi:isoleucyl-tRNA synthetase
VRIGDEILQRVADAYRKVRNTFRFLLGNLYDFTADQAVPESDLTRVDRAFLEHLRVKTRLMREALSRSEFHRATDLLLNVCTVDLSAVFLDLTKDRLYTLAPEDRLRRSAQTVLWEALHDLCIAASPILAFTADEVWAQRADFTAEAESVHLAVWPRRSDPGQEVEWELLLEVREAVNAAIEPLRADKTLATTAEAEVTVRVAPAHAERLRPYQGELAGFLIVARATVVPASAGQSEPIRASVQRTADRKCERCWTYRPDVAGDGERAGLCARCVAALTASGRAAGA